MKYRVIGMSGQISVRQSDRDRGRQVVISRVARWAAQVRPALSAACYRPRRRLQPVCSIPLIRLGRTEAVASGEQPAFAAAPRARDGQRSNGRQAASRPGAATRSFAAEWRTNIRTPWQGRTPVWAGAAQMRHPQELELESREEYYKGGNCREIESNPLERSAARTHGHAGCYSVLQLLVPLPLQHDRNIVSDWR